MALIDQHDDDPATDGGPMMLEILEPVLPMCKVVDYPHVDLDREF